ncbi:SusC/RagA family TonB-linked outer membrane protein [Galbibacter sp. PAP.153]|uniref:SusC/RagA family TonB-linked outer membrane protein n=1 Tax=Galbibacter sp. PAP.153 TaxID=3104623 RepID=UPI003009A14A
MRTKFSGFLTLILALVVQITFAQEKTVTGLVTDQDGLPLPGASVVVKGTNNGTQTDFDGNYSIQASTGDVLVFSYVGQKTEERSIGTQNTIDITLSTDAQTLGEVVVTAALGLQRNSRELSYSVAKVDNDQLTETRSVNAATALAGKVSGLQVNTISSGVNPNTRVILRGNRSLLGNNEALIVIDGYPSNRGVLDRINPDDIQDITVLKGSNAAALYGSDASNGVVLITTKKGTNKLQVTFNSTYQQESISYMPEFQDEFGVGGFPDGTLYPLENVNWGPRFDGRLVDASETYPDGRVLQVPYSPIPNNHRSFFETGSTIRNGVTVQGGDNVSNFLFSIDHSNIKGTIPKDQYNRTNVRLKGGLEYGKFTINGNASFFRSHTNQVGSGGHQSRPLYWYVINTPLHIPITNYKNWRNGEFTRNEVSYYRFYENPYFIVDTQRNLSDTFEFTFITDANYEFTDWFEANVRMGYTKYSDEQKDELGGLSYDFTIPNDYATIAEFPPSVRDEIFNRSRFNSDFILTFDKDLGDLHANVNIGNNVRIENEKNIQVSGNNLILPDFYNVSTRTGNLEGFENSEEYRKIGVYGDLTLNYKDYLILNASGRNDWTSTLPKDSRSYFYPSGGISFVPTTAFPAIKGTLNYLKTTFNIAKTGNDLSPYDSNRSFFAPDGSQGYGSFPYGANAGLSLSSQEPDPNLKPEFTTSMEAGVEFGFFNGDRLSGGVTLYKTNSTDQLVPINTSVTSGARSIFTNIGEIQNRGIEIDLRGGIIRNEDLSWDVNLNYSLNDSKVLSLKDGVNQVEIGGPYADNSAYGAVIVAEIGQPYPLIKTTDYQRDEFGRVIVGDDGDPLEDGDLKSQGKTVPTYIVGLNSTLNYKGFKLYTVMDYRTGHVFYNNLVDALEFTGLTQHSVTSNRQPFIFPNSVYSDGNGGYVENTDRPTTGGGNNFWDTYNNTKSNYVTDATTLKLREVALSYSFDLDAIGNLGLTNLNIGIYGRNLVTWRPKDNVYTDPEFNYNSGNATGFGSQSQTAPTRQYGITLTAKF